MRGAAEQASSIIDNAREQATLEKQQIIDAAQKQASHIEKSAHEEVERKLEAQTQMRQAITEVAMAAAGQILSQELDEERQKKIIDDFIDSDGLGA